jgi:hypothetical protein
MPQVGTVASGWFFADANRDRRVIPWAMVFLMLALCAASVAAGLIDPEAMAAAFG